MFLSVVLTAGDLWPLLANMENVVASGNRFSQVLLLLPWLVNVTSLRKPAEIIPEASSPFTLRLT